MEAFIISFFAVATAEIGDKTQLVALCLASRFGKPVPVIIGMSAAVIANHVVAALVGHWLGALLSGNVLHILLVLSFFGAAIWAFIPDKEEDIHCDTSHAGIALASFVTFFLAEMGDKTQLATVALAAQFNSLASVVLGTIAGMFVIDIPTVLFGHTLSKRVPLGLVRTISGGLFALLGLYELSKIWYG